MNKCYFAISLALLTFGPAAQGQSRPAKPSRKGDAKVQAALTLPPQVDATPESSKAQDQADTSGIEAAIQQLDAATAELQFTTPDPETSDREFYHKQNSQSRTDSEIFFDKLKEKAEGVSLDSADAVDRLEKTALSTVKEVVEVGGAFLDASTPSNTVGYNADLPPEMQEEQKRRDLEFTRAWLGVENARQNLENENRLLLLHYQYTYPNDATGPSIGPSSSSPGQTTKPTAKPKPLKPCYTSTPGVVCGVR